MPTPKIPLALSTPVPIDYDNTYMGQLFTTVENPDSIGYENGRWYQFKDAKGFSPKKFDPYGIGIGLDVRYNNYLQNFPYHVDSKGRKYLTEEEERNIRHHNMYNAEQYLDNALASSGITATPDPIKKATTISYMLNRGSEKVKPLLNNASVMDSFVNGTPLEYSQKVNGYFAPSIRGTRGENTNTWVQKASSRRERMSEAYRNKRAEIARRLAAVTPIPYTPSTGSGISGYVQGLKNKYGLKAEGGSLNNGTWDSLSLKEKNDVIKVAVRNGLTTIPEIKAKYNELNSFDNGGSINKDWEDWKTAVKLAKGIDVDKDNTYDYRSFYEDSPEQAWQIITQPKEAHFTDRYKTVYHPTFSTDSIYSGKYHPIHNPNKLVGGKWRGKEFIMSPDGYRGPVSMDDRLDYLEMAEPNGVVLRESNGKLPRYSNIFDNTMFGGVLPEATITPNSKNMYPNGGYKPSSAIKKRISNWEGKAMTEYTYDPNLGRVVAPNASFDTVARDFVNVIPRSIRNQVLGNQNLADYLYSYAYNVGPGNFKKRVVPALMNYYSGKGSAEDVAESMWATGDRKKNLSGLRKRRAVERNGVRMALGLKPKQYTNADFGLRSNTKIPMVIPSQEELWAVYPAFVPSNHQAFFNPELLNSQQVEVKLDNPLVGSAEAYAEELQRQEALEKRQNANNLLGMLLGGSGLGASPFTTLINNDSPLVSLASMMQNSSNESSNPFDYTANLFEGGGPKVTPWTYKGEHIWNEVDDKMYDLNGNRVRFNAETEISEPAVVTPSRRQKLDHPLIWKDVANKSFTNTIKEKAIRNTTPDSKALSAITGGMIDPNRLSASQNLRFGYDLLTGNFEDAGRGLVYGNSGLVSKKFEEEHPYWSMAINGAADIAGGLATGLAATRGVGAVRPLANNVGKTLNKTGQMLTSPYTGKWTRFGAKEYRFKPGTLGMNFAPIESRTVEGASPGLLDSYRIVVPRFLNAARNFIGTHKTSRAIHAALNVFKPSYTRVLAKSPELIEHIPLYQFREFTPKQISDFQQVWAREAAKGPYSKVGFIDLQYADSPAHIKGLPRMFEEARNVHSAIDAASEFGNTLGNRYHSMMNELDDPILKHIAEVSPQYLPEVVRQQRLFGKASEEFVRGLIGRANSYRRFMREPHTPEEFLQFKGKSLGHSTLKHPGTSTIDAAMGSTDEQYGRFGAYFMGRPKLTGDFSTWWDQRIPAGVSVKPGLYTTDIYRRKLQKIVDSYSGSGADVEIENAFTDAYRKTGAPIQFIEYPDHQIFWGKTGDTLPNFEVSVVNNQTPLGWNKYGKGYALGGNLYGNGNPLGNFVTNLRRKTNRQITEAKMTPEQRALSRAYKVYSNYNEAKDAPLDSFTNTFRNGLRSVKDKVWKGAPAGVSNCTLTATQWIDPNNPIKNASSIVNNPEKYGYVPIEEDEANIGNLLITKVPGKDIYHTMMIDGIAPSDGVYSKDNVQYPYKEGDITLSYSTGGHYPWHLRKGIPMSYYNANSDGHTEKHYYKYKPQKQ